MFLTSHTKVREFVKQPTTYLVLDPADCNLGWEEQGSLGLGAVMTPQLAIDWLVVGWGHLGSLPSVLAFLCLSHSLSRLVWLGLGCKFKQVCPSQASTKQMHVEFLGVHPSLMLALVCFAAFIGCECVLSHI